MSTRQPLPSVRPRVYSLALALTLLFSACSATTESGEPDPGPTTVREDPAITDLRHAVPLVVGSIIEVTVAGDYLFDGDPPLSLAAAGASVTLPVAARDRGRLTYAVDASVLSTLGAGTTTVDLVVADRAAATPVRAATLTLATEIPVRLDAVVDAPAYYNQPIVLTGDGFLADGEGAVQARFVGTFTPDGGASETIDVSAPTTLAEPFSRSRGLVSIPPALGALRAGALDGTVSLESALVGGGTSTSAPLPVQVTLRAPEVFRLEDDTLSIGQMATFVGAGFVADGGSTLLRFDGTFTGEIGGVVVPLERVDLVPIVDAGDRARLVIEASERGGQLRWALVDQDRGRFEGTVTVITTDGVNELVGAPAPITFELVGVTQVVYVRFLPGFRDSLKLFGLAAASVELEAGIVARMGELFGSWAVDVRAEPPVDYDVNHYARVEIGGPDPNGIGLFGFDNTPGKDIGNLRLFDVIGGANFDTQEDGFPGYGGVFIESMLYWASDPPLPGERPPTAPPADEDFDRIFEPLFDEPATLAEARGGGDPERVAEVAAAVSALANAIGETAAHELGHSFGLAQPFTPNAYHNDEDGPGCLMDTGAERPFGERAGLEGFELVHLCNEAPSYLRRILPR